MSTDHEAVAINDEVSVATTIEVVVGKSRLSLTAQAGRRLVRQLASELGMVVFDVHERGGQPAPQMDPMIFPLAPFTYPPIDTAPTWIDDHTMPAGSGSVISAFRPE